MSQMFHERRDKARSRFSLGIIGLAAHAQPRFDKRTDEPRPNRALMIGAIALAHGNAGEIVLLLTDVVMPEMSGKELSDLLRAHYPRLKTLFMSGYTSNAINSKNVLEDGVEFIQKPFTLADLGRKLGEILGLRQDVRT